MAVLRWERGAAEGYGRVLEGLPPHRREQVEGWLDLLRDWPPGKWYLLRDEGAFIAFRLDNDKFLKILGRFDEAEGVVWITHFERRNG